MADNSINEKRCCPSLTDFMAPSPKEELLYFQACTHNLPEINESANKRITKLG